MRKIVLEDYHVVSFLAIYLGVVFMICSAAILAIQQLSEASDNRERYRLLHQLGAERADLNRALFTQVLFYFLLPLGLAVIHSIAGLIAVNQVMKFGQSNVGVTVAFVIGVYGLYLGLTYASSKKIIS